MEGNPGCDQYLCGVGVRRLESREVHEGFVVGIDSPEDRAVAAACTGRSGALSDQDVAGVRPAVDVDVIAGAELDDAVISERGQIDPAEAGAANPARDRKMASLVLDLIERPRAAIRYRP